MAQFDEALCGCLSELCSCLVAWCVPGGYCFLQAKAVDIATQEGMVVPYILPCLLGCIGGAINRGKIREVYKIDGNFVTDCLLHFLCTLCAVTQEYREVNHRSSGN